MLEDTGVHLLSFGIAIYRDFYISVRPAETLAEGLAQPTLIVWGEQDRVLDPSGAVTLSRLLPQSRVNYLSGVGHLPQLEAPRQVADDYQWSACAPRLLTEFRLPRSSKGWK